MAGEDQRQGGAPLAVHARHRRRPDDLQRLRDHTFVYNFLSVDRTWFTAKGSLPRGKTTFVVDFRYDGGGMGKGGSVTLSANGATIAEGRLERTIPIQLTLGEGLDIGLDVGSAMDFTYKLPFAFSGKIEKVAIDLK